MPIDKETKKNEVAIQESIDLYKKVLLEDINLKLRVIVKEKTYITKLIDWPDDKFIFAAPLDKLDWVLFEKGKVVQVVFITKASMFSAKVQILNRYRKNDMLFYGAILLEPLSKNQQRQYYRVEVLLESKYKVLPQDEEGAIIEELIDDIPFEKATIVNISIGGLCLVSPQKMKKNSIVGMIFDFMNYKLNLMGQILFDGEKNHADQYVHRIQFLNLDNSMKNLLNKLVLDKQRAILNKNKQ